MIKKITLNLTTLLFLLLFTNCSKHNERSETNIEDKLFQLENKGWKSKSVIHSIGEMNFKASQVPLQYYILKQEGNSDLNKIDAIYQSLKEERIIEFEFLHENKEDLFQSEFTNLDYESSVKYMAFTIQNDFSVVLQSNDTIQCSGVILERNFKLAPFKRLLVSFTGIPENEPIQLLYNDKLYNNGLMKFHFTDNPIKL